METTDTIEQSKPKYNETLEGHVYELGQMNDRLRLENNRLRDENYRLRELCKEYDLGLCIQYGIDNLLWFLKF